MPYAKLYVGDNQLILPKLPDASVDAIVTDPPAGIGFMGKEWDDFRRARNQNDAGRDSVFGRTSARGPQYGRRGARKQWLYPTTTHGFTDGGDRLASPIIGEPSRNPTCRICGRRQRSWRGGPERCDCANPDFDNDAARIDAREAFVYFMELVMRECLRIAKPGAYALIWAIPRTSHWTAMGIENAGWVISDRISHLFGSGFPKHKSKLKPACEDWWLCWKPDRKATPLNIDDCRVQYLSDADKQSATPQGTCTSKDKNVGAEPDAGREQTRVGFDRPAQVGRWPANVVLSHHPDCNLVGRKPVKANGHFPSARGAGGVSTSGHAGQAELEEKRVDSETVEDWRCHEDCPVRRLDEQSGITTSGAMKRQVDGYDGASNTGFLRGRSGPSNQRSDSGGASRFFYCAKASKSDRGEGNTHPTVKNTALMEWLIRLVSTEGSTILDPFSGSGSTGVAAVRTKRNFIGIEQNDEYMRFAESRINEELGIFGKCEIATVV